MRRHDRLKSPADMIRGMRRELGLTQAQLAGALGVHPNTLARWERGEITPQYPIMLGYALLYLAEHAWEVVTAYENPTKSKEIG